MHARQLGNVSPAQQKREWKNADGLPQEDHDFPEGLVSPSAFFENIPDPESRVSSPIPEDQSSLIPSSNAMQLWPRTLWL